MLIADTPYPHPVQTLQGVGGSSLAYTEQGAGFPLVFIHGLGSSIPAWQKNIPVLSKHFRCLALDLPGFGKSAKEGFTPGMEYYADVVSAFLDRLQISECYLAGHSMGGQVAIHTALKYPQKVKKLVLLAPAGLETFSAAESTRLKSWFEADKVLAAGPEIIEQNVKANFYRFPEDAQPILQARLQYKACADYPRFCQVLSDSVGAMLQEPVYDRLPTLAMPVLVLFGRQDGSIPSRLLHPDLDMETMLEVAVAAISKGSYRLLDSCGHFVQWEQAEWVNKVLLRFLQE